MLILEDSLYTLLNWLYRFEDNCLHIKIIDVYIFHMYLDDGGAGVVVVVVASNIYSSFYHALVSN